MKASLVKRIIMVVLITMVILFALFLWALTQYSHSNGVKEPLFARENRSQGDDVIVTPDEQEVISFEEVRPMFESHKEDLELLYSAFETRFRHINIGFNRETKTYNGSIGFFDKTYIRFEDAETEELYKYIDDRGVADAAARVLSEMDGMKVSYVIADESTGREASFGVILYPGIVSVERSTTVTGDEDLWQTLGDGWCYSVWQCPDG